MSSSVIKVENISKQYRLGDIGTGSLSHDINRFWHKVRGKEDPYLKIGEVNDRTSKSTSDYVWSLRDVNFDVKQGDAVGIMGRNGAGKSTLLKILSRVTAPTTGSIKVKGRIASLLEVGTGFHPDLSGRDNIFLNGAILGMRKQEIKRKFDEIVDFAGVERYIDTPVKRYSSGMYVRLAFAVAAYLESEILIVDEVLAVGDAEFQKKCLGKMGDVSKGEGRTILFVSHNMAALETLCKSAVFLENGLCKFTGDIKDAISLYIKPKIKIEGAKIIDNIDFVHPDVIINDVTVNDSQDTNVNVDLDNNVLEIKIKGELKDEKNIAFGLTMYDHHHNTKLAIFSPGHITGIVKKYNAGNFEIIERVYLPQNITKGKFSIDIALHEPNIELFMTINNHITVNTQSMISATGLEFEYDNNGLLIL